MSWIDRLPELPFPLRVGVILLIAVLAALVTFSFPSFPQPPWYHGFADQRMVAGVPNFANVVSNAAFLLAGMAGLRLVLRLPAEHPATRLPYLVFAVALMLVALGSAYYHWRPGTERLYWDRLPMTVAFMALLAGLIADRIDRRAGLVLLPLLLISGFAAVTYWRQSELAGAGDLRPYFLVQIVAALSLPLILLLFRDQIGGERFMVLLLVLYALAVALENSDRWILETTAGAMSGHTLKHLAAALAAYLALHRLSKSAA